LRDEDRLFSIIIDGLTASLAFIVLAVRIATKKLSIKEVVVLFLIMIAVDLGSRLLFPYYLSFPFAMGFLFLIIGLIHIRAVRRLNQQDNETNEIL
jgi:hypothetical protein